MSNSFLWFLLLLASFQHALNVIFCHFHPVVLSSRWWSLYLVELKLL